MALWQQYSPYVSSCLTQGFCRWRRKEKLAPWIFTFLDCKLDVPMGEFKQDAKVDSVQLDFEHGNITITGNGHEGFTTTPKKTFRGLLGLNVWCKGRCVWNMITHPRTTSFLTSIFTFNEFMIENDEIHFFECIMSSEVAPFSKGEYVPVVVINWMAQTIQIFDDPTGRVFEGVLGWCILKPKNDSPKKILSLPQKKSNHRTFTPWNLSIPDIHLPPPILSLDDTQFIRYLSNQ